MVLIPGVKFMFLDESAINETRRKIYINRIRSAIGRIGSIDGIDATKLARDLVESFDFALRHHLAEWSRVALHPHVGVGTLEWVRVRGRVAERSNVAMCGPDDEVFDILVSCWYRFLISGQPCTPVLVKRGTREVLTGCDEEGFFDVTISAQPELGDVDYSVDIELGSQATVRADRATARVLVPHPAAHVGVLVDLDGLLLSHSPNRFSQTLGELVLGEPQRIRPALEKLDVCLAGISQGALKPNPLFYLSNAPRHLNDHLEAAIRYGGLPDGYLQLRDYDLRLRRLTTSHVNVVEMLLGLELVDQYPELPFIFVGNRERAKFYEPLINALNHRLSSVYLLGEEGLPSNIQALSTELGVECVSGSGERLLMHMVQKGWAHA